MIITLYKATNITKTFQTAFVEESRLTAYLNTINDFIYTDARFVYFSYNGSFPVEIANTNVDYDYRLYNYGKAELDNVGNAVYFFIDSVDNHSTQGNLAVIVHYTLDVWHSNIRNGIKIYRSQLYSCGMVYSDSRISIEPVPNGKLTIQNKITNPNPYTYRIYATLSFYNVQQAGVVSERYLYCGFILAKLHTETGNPTGLFENGRMNQLIKILKYHMSSQKQFRLTNGNLYYYDIVDLKIMPYSSNSPSAANWTATLEDVGADGYPSTYDIVFQAAIPTYNSANLITIQETTYRFNTAYQDKYFTSMYYGLFGYLKKCKHDVVNHRFGIYASVEENMWHIYFKDEDGIVDISDLFSFKDGIVPDSSVAVANERLGRFTSTIGSVVQTAGGVAMLASGIASENVVSAVTGSSMMGGGIANIIKAQGAPSVSSSISAVRSLSPFINAQDGLIIVHSEIVNETEMLYSIQTNGYETNEFVTDIPIPTATNPSIPICFKNARVYGVCQDDVVTLKNILEKGTVLRYN